MNKIKDSLKFIKSDNIENIKKGLDILSYEGTEKEILFLIHEFNCSESNQEKYDLLYNFLISIKNQRVVDLIISCLKENKYSDIRKKLLSICWEMGFDVSEYFNELIDLISSLDVFELVELITLFDNMKDQEGFFSEEDLINAKIEILENKETLFSDGNNEYKIALLDEILTILESFRVE